jgi:AraC-like DNA-binding protein
MEETLKENRSWTELAKVARYNVGSFAKLCRLSNRQLQRQFRSYLGCSPQVWLDEQRIAAACPLLLSGKSVKMVAYDLGFKQTSHFCRKFKAANKMTPSQFIVMQVGSAAHLCRS